MLQPRRSKYRKQFRGTMKGMATRGTTLAFGEYGLQAAAIAWVSSKQIEAARRAISNFTKRGGRTFIRVFPHKPITQKPPEVRMGGGKGDIKEYVAEVKAGTMMFEMSGVTREIATEALRLAAYKLPVKSKVVIKGEN